MEAARDVLVKGTTHAIEREDVYPPAAYEVTALVVEQPDGSYVTDVVVERIGYDGASGMMTSLEEDGHDGFTHDGEYGTGVRTISEAVQRASSEVLRRMGIEG